MRVSHYKIAYSVIAASLALSLTACSGAGPDAATRMIKQVTDGAEKTITDNGNDIALNNLVLVATEDGSAVLVGSMVNHAKSSDKLLGISVGSATASLTGLTTLATDAPIRFEGDQANAKAVFTGVGAVAGTVVTLNIGFAKAGLVQVNAIIRDKRDIYAGVTTGAVLATNKK